VAARPVGQPGRSVAVAYSFAGKRVLITGAASGIGRATALRLAREGAELYLTDLNAEGLDDTAAAAAAAGATVAELRALDISDYDAVAGFAADIHAAHPAMDVVMNIAGISAWGTVNHLTHQHWRSMVDVNLMGPIHVIETFVPPMVAARRGGRLVNVSSAAGLVALPWHAAYSASKFGLRGLSEVLRFDLARHRIGVCLAVPGAVDTPLVQTVHIAGIDREDPGVQRWIKRFSGHAVSPEKAADKIVAGVAKNRFLIYTSGDIRALYAFKRLAWLPYSLVMKQVNVVFTRVLRPGGASARERTSLPPGRG
jgi:NAD(P)-dependent dehydrogenase (short-subunit alcohol dehydrogenase family)